MNIRLIRMSILWILTAVIMCMHETFDVAGLIHGVDIRAPKANGTIPFIQHALRLVFDIGSMLIGVVILYAQPRWLRWTLLIWAGIIVPANVMHVWEIYKEDPQHYSQIGLLTFALLISILVFVDNYKWVKE